MSRYDGATAAVIGGSIGGLTAALLLRDLGFSVQVFERTPTPLDGRGGGIVLQPDCAGSPSAAASSPSRCTPAPSGSSTSTPTTT